MEERLQKELSANVEKMVNSSNAATNTTWQLKIAQNTQIKDKHPKIIIKHLET